MSKNIKISNIDSDKLLNGEMNEKGIKIGNDVYEFLLSSFDNSFDYVRAEAEVDSINGLKDLSSYRDENEDDISGNYKLNVSFCKDGKIESVDSIEYINDYEERNIDGIFPFNEICLVTKNIGSNGVENSTWIDSLHPNRGYYVTNYSFLRGASQDDVSTYVPKELILNSHDDEFIEDLEDTSFGFNKTFVRIPRFYIRIYFFLNKKDNKYYRRYEIISPFVYNSLPDKLKFGFFVPKAFGDDKYLYISHVPESFGLVSSPFGSETGYFNETNHIIMSKLNKFKIMTSDVWFGIVHILFKIYIGYMNPRALLARYFYDYPSLYKKQWDGVNSIFSIFHNGVSGDGFFEYSETEGNRICLDVTTDVFISEEDQSDPPQKIIISNAQTPCADMKDFVKLGQFTSESTLIYQNRLKFSIELPDEGKYLITNIVFWNAAETSSVSDNDNTPVYCDLYMIINRQIPNSYGFTCYRYLNRDEFGYDIEPPELEEIKYNTASYVFNTATNKFDLEFNFENLPQGTFDSSSVSVQFVVFKERFNGDKKKIVRDTLLGKNVILGCRTSVSNYGLSKEDEVAYFDVQFYDPDVGDISTTDNLYSYNLNFLNYDFGFNDPEEPVKFNREYDALKIKKYFDNWKSQSYKISLYRHPMHEISGNYYNCDKRFFVDLFKKNESLGCRFSLLYFSNFMLPFSYRDSEQIKNTSYYPKYTTRYEMPYLGDEEIVHFDEIETQQGVLLNDVVAEQRKKYVIGGHVDEGNAGEEYIKFIYEDGRVLEPNWISFNDTHSPICVVGDHSQGKLYCDEISTSLLPVDYTDGVLSSVFVYSKENYYINLPTRLKTLNSSIKGYDIQKPMCVLKNANAGDIKEDHFWISSGYLQYFKGEISLNSIGIDQINDKVSFNLNGISFTLKESDSSISQQNVLLYVSGN